MNKYAKYIAIALAITVILALPMHGVFAQAGITAPLTTIALSKVAGPAMLDLALNGLVYLTNIIMQGVSFILLGTGVLLNASLTLTLHISTFVKNITGIYEVWQALRDLSALFLIFFLLWAAIQMILGLNGPKVTTLIKDLVIAGVLINFSFFFASILIDASNIVSLQIYKQIVPPRVYNNVKIPFPNNSAPNTQSGQSLMKIVTEQAFQNGGLSDIFMASFNMSAFQGNLGQFSGNSAEVSMKMLVMQIIGIGAMLVASFLFLFASLAFLFRLGILIFLLAFSPVYFAAFIIPNLKEYASKGWEMFRSQLVFMPVFLLLMYMSLKVIATGNFTGTTLNNQSDFWLALIGLLGNFFFVIVLLLIPFFAAMKMGGMSAKLAGKWSQNFRRWSTSVVGRNTVGRAAYGLNESSAIKRLATYSPTIGGWASGGLSKLSSAKYTFDKGKGGTSYESVLKQRKKDYEAMHKKIKSVDESKYKNKEELDAAKEEAQKLAATYRSSLVINNPVLKFMFESRAARQTEDKLRKEAEKEIKKKKIKPNKAKINALNKEEIELTEERTTNTRFGSARYEEINKRLEEIKAEKKTLNEEITEAEELIEEDKNKKLVDEVRDAAKGEGGEKGGGGGGGGDKKGEDKGDK